MSNFEQIEFDASGNKTTTYNFYETITKYIMSSIKYWGEIEKKTKDTYIPDVTADIERSMSKFCLAEFDAGFDTDQKSEQIM